MMNKAEYFAKKCRGATRADNMKYRHFAKLRYKTPVVGLFLYRDTETIQGVTLNAPY